MTPLENAMTPLENMNPEKTFSEVIKVRDGKFYNLPCHQARADRTAMHLFDRRIELSLTPEMIPDGLRSGLVKCRVVYGASGIVSVEFAPYVFRTIRSVAVVHDDTIDYSYKSTDRSRLAALVADSGCDDIIIVKNGFVTDSSFANLVLEDATGALYTPSHCLLAGTKRASLMDDGTIDDRPVRAEELYDASKIYLINAMTDLEDRVVLPPLSR